MPEVWLRYGNTHVVLELKMENFAGQVSSKFQPAPQKHLQAEIDTINLTDEMLILALTGSKATANVVSLLIESARKKGISSVTLDAPTAVASSLRTALDDPKYKESKVSVNRLDYGFPILDRTKKFRTSILVSHSGVDPLFGYSGGPTLLLRYFLVKEMAEAFSLAKNVGPKPAYETEARRRAMEVQIDGITGIEIVADLNGVASTHIGEPREAFQKASQDLKTKSAAQVEESGSIVASPSSDPFGHATLSTSLNSLWNVIGSGVLKEGGRIILVSECRNGTGSTAVQRFVEGRLGTEQEFTKLDYVDGLEHLVYLNELKQKYQLALVSALPNYYASEKLGFATFAGMREVANALVAKQVRSSSKSLVISDPDVTILSPRS